MPLPNEHVARVRDPKDFDEDTFRSKDIETGIRIIVGKLKGATDDDDPMITESYHFDAGKFSEAKAKKWLKDHDITYIKFEPATGASEEEQIEEVTEGANAMEKEKIKKETGVQHKQFSIQHFKSGKTDDGKTYIEGYANTKNKEDRYGDIPTVFSKLRDYVYELKDFAKNPVLLLDHMNMTGNIAGSFNPKYGGHIYEDEIGLKFKAVFSDSDYPPVKHARTVYSEGHGRALSIGGQWFYEDGDNPDHLTLAKIFEVSLVGVGADGAALTFKGTDADEVLPKTPYSEGLNKTDPHQAGLPEDEKVGRVLSKANEGKIRKAHEALSNVLDSLSKEEERQWEPKSKTKKTERIWKFRLKKSSLKN